MKRLRAICLAASILGSLPALAQAPETIKVGVLSDMSGPFSDEVGAGSVVAAQMAAEDFAAESRGLKVEIVSADHQNKPDIGLGIARRWLDQENVSAIVDLPNSGVALGVANLMKEKHRVALTSSSMTSDLTGKFCAPTTVQWVTDTWAQGSGTVQALAKEGLKSWFFLTVDYALGQALERDASSALTAAGGKVAGVVRSPLGTPDFASPLLSAQGSGAEVLALASTGSDMINAIKQAGEFGLKTKIAPLFVELSDIHSIGFPVAQGLRFVEAFYWDANDSTRAWSKRWSARMAGRMPTEDHAGVYSATLAYLRAVREAKTVEGETVVAEMKKNPIQDPLFGPTTIRADGRAVHDMYLFEVKKPDEVRYPYDYYRTVATIPASSAFRPMEQGGCAMVAK